jgi:hypothetical protein
MNQQLAALGGSHHNVSPPQQYAQYNATPQYTAPPQVKIPPRA